MNIINHYFSNLKQKEDIYVTDLERDISYPSEGNKIYFDIEETSFWFKHRNKCIATLVKKYSPNSLFFDINVSIDNFHFCNKMLPLFAAKNPIDG